MKKRLYGLIGFPLGHSFSQRYFTEKFFREGITDARFELFPIEDINLLPALIQKQPDLAGLSVTIPYKEQVIPFLDELDESAASVGAVNNIRVGFNGSKPYLKGYNTDVYGFSKSLGQIFIPENSKALVLGTGGASKAITHVLNQRNIDYLLVSRKPSSEGQISYQQLTSELIEDYQLIINATPVGTYPQVNQSPPLPYSALTQGHILFDLVYNPTLTLFLKQGQEKGCKVKNGESMLYFQAQKSWEIWNSNNSINQKIV